MTTINVGFTGTRRPPTKDQEHRLLELLLGYKSFHKGEGRNVVVHHGDCVGADALAHRTALKIGYGIIKHPPVISRNRAFCEGGFARPVAPYMERNQIIVNESEILIAVPKEKDEQLRSGTWATVRMAAAKKIPIWIVGPDGKVWRYR